MSGGEGPVMLFDGHCNLCNAAVDFVLRHESDHALRFASLQSATAEALLDRAGYRERPDSVLYVRDGKVLAQSDAALAIARHLRLPWRAITWTRWIPRVVRDAVYRFIAARRYRWFGRRETCRVATSDEKARFV